MKRTMLLVAAIGAFATCSAITLAGSVTSGLQPGDCLAQVDNGIHANGYGYVVIKAVKGGYDVTFQLWNAAPSYKYWACSGTELFLGFLTTNGRGRGNLTVHVRSDPGTWGHWIGLREASGLLSQCDSPEWPYTPQSLWAAPNPFNLPPPITP